MLNLAGGDQIVLEGVRSSLADKGTVVLYSCHTGEGGAQQDNIANMLSSAFPQADHVYAPAGSPHGMYFEWGTGVDQNTITGVHYGVYGPQIPAYDAAGQIKTYEPASLLDVLQKVTHL